MTIEAKSAVEQMLTGIVRSLVDRPDDVAVELVEDESGATLWIRSHPADVGRVIGEQGRTVRAIRVVVYASAVKLGCGRLNVEIWQPRGCLPTETE